MSITAQCLAGEIAVGHGFFAAYEHLAQADTSRIDRFSGKLHAGIFAPNAAFEFIIF